MKSIKDLDVEEKRVLVRCDFNVPLNKNGEIEDDFKISQTIPTIKYLIDNEAKIILLSHLGRPKGEVVEELRLDPVAKRLSELLKRPVKKLNDCVGKEVEGEVQNIKSGDVILLENIQFNPGETANNPKFARTLASYADIFTLEAFGQSHRDYASISGLAKHLPSAAGFLLEKELKVFSKVLNDPWRPLVVIVGGTKIETKVKLINYFLKKADYVLVGGIAANTLLKTKGIYITGPLPEKDIIKEVEKIDLTSTKLHLPVDALASPDKTGKSYIKEAATAKIRKEELLLDIGPETIKMFCKIIKDAKMIIWNGPIGFFEQEPFNKGTNEVAEAIVRNHKAYKIIGGGDTIFAVSKIGLLDKFDHISTGGGAMLNFLSGEKLPGLEALKK